MKLQAIKQNVPTQENQENIQSLATKSCQSDNLSEDQEVAYFVLSFEELLGDIPVVIVNDLSFLSEVKRKYPEGAYWSISALKRFIEDKNNHNPNLFRAICLIKSTLGGRLIQ